MKCPNCGFISFPDPLECKKCGHRFTRPSGRAASSGATRAVPSLSQEAALPDAGIELRPSVISGPAFAFDPPILPSARMDAGEFSLSSAAPDPAAFASAREQPLKSEPSPWEDELAERVARYKRRRSRAGPVAGQGRANLEFDFDRQVEVENGGAELDADIRTAAPARRHAPALDSIALGWNHPAADVRKDEAVEWALEPRDDGLTEAPEVRPVEVVLGSNADDGEGQEAVRQPARLAASVPRRFAAGAIDAVVLALAAGLFAAVFLVSGGPISQRPSSLMEIVGGLTAAFFALFYFALFSAVSSATPGQSAMGLRVRTLDDRRPDWPAARRRAFGYLVSAAALGIGFVWAAFDGEGLTWHDRMSGTCLASISRPREMP